MTNLITRLGWEARLGKDAERPLEQSAAELVDYLLFVDEAPLPGPISGTSSFAADFAARGPRDAQGRSLRDLALTDRLMEYRCSYLIYSRPSTLCRPLRRHSSTAGCGKCSPVGTRIPVMRR